jgi:D-beta-D-heptose 7-phosphate kinase/D-beta-D-heptose 1-phosphate adenosyltransferase
VVWVDRETTTAHPARFVIDKVRELLPQLDAVIFEDYGKGLLQQGFVDEVASVSRREGKLVTADPNPHNRLIWRGITAVKPNRSEAFAAANQPWHEPESEPLSDAHLLLVGAELLRIWKPDHLLVTLGARNDSFRPRQAVLPYPSRAREVYDLSGAGDTAIAL